MGYTNYNSNGVQAYTSTLEFPAQGAFDGDLALANDTDTLYTWNQPTLAWLAIATPGAAIAIDGLSGDVSATGPGVVAATVNSVGGQTAAAVASSVTGVRSIALGGTNASSFTAPSGTIAPLVYFDGTRLATDTLVNHLGYDTATDTVYLSSQVVSSGNTNNLKMVNTTASSPTQGSGISGYSDDGAALIAGDRLGYYLLGGSTDAAHTLVNTAGMTAFATENWSGTAAGSGLLFETTANAGLVRSAKMSILGSGNVGIGTTSPGNLLHINSGATPATGSVRLTANNLGSISYFVYSANNSAMSFDSDYAGAAWVARDTSAFSIYKNSGNLNFYGDSGLTLNGAFTPTNRMTLTGAGLLGVGLAAPTHKLEVTGVGQLTAALTDAGDKTNALFLSSTSTSAGAGGTLVFGNVQSTGAGAEGFAAIKGLLTSGAGTTTGALAISTRNATTDTSLTERARFHSNGGLSIGSASKLGDSLTLAATNSTVATGSSYLFRGDYSTTIASTGTHIGQLLINTGNPGVGNTIANITGIQVQNVASAGGTVTTFIGSQIASSIYGTVTNSFCNYANTTFGATAVVTNSYTYYAAPPVVTAGGTVSGFTYFQTAALSQVFTGLHTVSGMTIGAISSALDGVANAAAYGLNIGAISSTNAAAASSNYGINIGAISGGVTSNFGIQTAPISSASAATNYGIAIGAVTGATTNLAIWTGGGQVRFTDAIARTAAFTGQFLNIASTSSTASVAKIGLDIQSTGTWNGAGATNTGLNVNVSGGTTNYAAVFSGGNVGIGTTTPNANAILDCTSTTQAFLPPRMTTTQKNAVASPVAGMIVYDSTLAKLCVYTGAAWQTITSV